MYAVIVRLTIDANREDEMRSTVHDNVVPTASRQSGFASGTWLRALDGDVGTAVMLFESEEAARSTAERIRAEGPLVDARAWSLQAVDAYEVLAQA
jgi:hypothetical protein